VEALAAVKSGDMSERKAAIHFRVPRSSLQDRIKNSSDIYDVSQGLDDKKAQLSLTNPRDAKACQNCFNSACLQRCR